MSHYESSLKSIIEKGTKTITESEVVEISEKFHKSMTKVKEFHKGIDKVKFHEGIDKVKRLVEEVTDTEPIADKNRGSFTRRLFGDYEPIVGKSKGLSYRESQEMHARHRREHGPRSRPDGAKYQYMKHDPNTTQEKGTKKWSSISNKYKMDGISQVKSSRRVSGDYGAMFHEFCMVEMSRPAFEYLCLNIMEEFADKDIFLRTIPPFEYIMVASKLREMRLGSAEYEYWGGTNRRWQKIITSRFKLERSRIHGDAIRYNKTGTVSMRYSSDTPNVCAAPRHDKPKKKTGCESIW